MCFVEYIFLKDIIIMLTSCFGLSRCALFLCKLVLVSSIHMLENRTRSLPHANQE